MVTKRTPTLDGAGKLLDKFTPDRLTDPSLKAAFATPQTLALRSSSYRRPPATVIADLGAAGHGFTAMGTPSASNMNETTDYVRGTQSAWVTTAGAGAVASIRKNVLPAAIDLTNKGISISVKVTNLAELKGIMLYVGDTSLANNYVWTLYDGNPGNTKPFADGEWVRLYADHSSLTATTGTPNLSAITAISVAFQDKNNGSTTGKVTGWLNHISTFPKPATYPNGVVSFTFDDGFASAATVAKPYMDRYGFSGTAYVIADLIDANSYYMTTPQLRTMQEFSGWDIAAHAYTVANHNQTGAFTALSDTALDTELRLLREWLTAKGFKGVDHFAYPQGLLNPATEAIVQRYFASARSTQQYPFETVPACNPLRLRAQSHSLGTTLATAKAKIDAAYANKSWDIITLHDLVTTPPTPPGTTLVQWDISSFQQTVDYAATKGIAVENVGTVLAKTQAPTQNTILDGGAP